MYRLLFTIFGSLFLLCVIGIASVLWVFWTYGRGLPDYQQLAEQLLELSSPDQVVAAFLQHVYGKSLLAEAYREIAQPEKRSKSNSDRPRGRSANRSKGGFNRSRNKASPKKEGKRPAKKGNSTKPVNKRPANKTRKRTKPKGTARQ